MRRVKSRRKYLGRVVMGVIAAAVVGWGMLLYFHPYGDNTSDYERSLADCMRDRTRVVDSPGNQDAAAAACVRDTPGDQSLRDQ
jgi:hypothetical protein